MEQKLDRILERLDKMDARIDQLASAVGHLRVGQKVLQEDVTEVRNFTRAIAERVLAPAERSAIAISSRDESRVPR